MAGSTNGSLLDVAALRAAEFPSVGEAAYLNAASVGPLPERALRALAEHTARRASPHRLGEADLLAPLRRSREAAARLIGADPGEIALGWNTSYGINLAALSLPVEPGSAVVTTEGEFPANVYPWMGMKDTHFELMPTDGLGRPDEDRLAARLERGDVSVFALSSVQFATGYRADLRRFGEICRERGIFFVVDAIQSLGQLPLDVREAKIDVLATGGHKWLCGPFGTGFAYVRRELLERMEPRVIGWTGMAACADLESLLDYRWEFRPDARRFETATLPFHDFAALAASLELLLEVGVENIASHTATILAPLWDWLGSRPGMGLVSDPDPERRSAIVAFRPRRGDEVYRALQEAGIACALREGSIRISPHLYNTPQEIERVIQVLERSAAA